MQIEYDKPFEVTAKQYHYLMANFKERVAGQIDGEKYYIKVWLMDAVPKILAVLKREDLK